MPLLGYDVDPKGSKLVVNDEEAARVRNIFALYLEHQGMLAVLQELERRGWRTSAGKPAREESGAGSRLPRPACTGC